MTTVAVEKPAYRIPLLSEIRAIEHNGLSVVSLFCGAGGSSTGYRLAGFRVLAAAEFVPLAADTYEANKADFTQLLRRDVRGLEADELLQAAGVEPGELDVLDGSPPCEPFSMAGKRERTWNQVRDYSGQRQRSDDLFFEYARLLKALQPRAFVAENVPGLARGRARGYFLRIIAALRDCGYRVRARVLDASWLGVPQERHRIIFVGVRNDLDAEPAFPEPLPYRFTVRDAIGDLLDGGQARMGTFGTYDHPRDITDDVAPTVVAGDSSRHWHVDGARVRMGSFHKKTHPSDITDNPAPTVVAGDSVFWHVDGEQGRQERRPLSLAELRRICGFPDDFVLLGSRSAQWERLGDAVPPPMAAAWARALRDGPLAA